MFSKFAIITLLVAVARCSASGGTSSFSYGVSDPTTGDVKDQHEKRIGDTVVGQYSVLEADGSKRIVEYSSDPHTGFKAIVKKDPAPGVHSGGLGLNSATPIAPALGYNGVNSLAHGGLNAWSPAGNLANGGYGTYGGYGAGNGWNQASINTGFGALANGWAGNNGLALNNGWNNAAAGAHASNGWTGNNGLALNNGWNTAATGAHASNGWTSNNGYNVLNNGWDTAATGTHASNGWSGNNGYNNLNNGWNIAATNSNGWPQSYGSYGAASPIVPSNGLHGAPATSYSNRNIGW